MQEVCICMYGMTKMGRWVGSGKVGRRKRGV